MARAGSEPKRSTAAAGALDLVLSRLPDSRRSGAGWEARCPAHDDQHASLSVKAGDTRAMVLFCHAGCSPEAVVRALWLDPRTILGARRNGVVVADDVGRARRANRRGHDRLTVVRLARGKGLPERFLRDDVGLRDAIGRPGVVEIPYSDPDGRELFARERTAASAKRGTKQPAGVGLAPYGLDRLAAWKASRAPLLVEGESDCWTAWYHGLTALGIPGASAAGCLEAEHVAGVARIYVLQEPDAGGTAFVAGVRQHLDALGWDGELLAFGLIVNG